MSKQQLNALYRRFIPALVLSVLLLLQSSCSGSSETVENSVSYMPPAPDPESYICYRTADMITLDGIMNEPAWEAVPRTGYFRDIEGEVKPEPRFRTYAKLLWDDNYLYIAAELEEPHIWATLRQRDTVIFYDNDFEVFIDPDGDTHAYYELEVNAYGTPWDLLLIKPYRDGGPAVINWDISGLKIGIDIDGTINDPADTDNNWSVEMAIPFQVLKECNRGSGFPKDGDQWRINFSRVEWRTIIESGRYRKEINPETGKPYPEDNWVWSPQGRINMHMPEMWGYLQFSSLEAGSDTGLFVRDRYADEKWALRMIYYAEAEYYKRYNAYSSRLKDLGLSKDDFSGLQCLPIINSTRTTFESYCSDEKGIQGWTIYNDGRIVNYALMTGSD